MAADPTGLDEHAAEVEQDEVDPVSRHACDARARPSES